MRLQLDTQLEFLEYPTMLRIRSNAALGLMLGGFLSFFSSAVRLHPHPHHDCTVAHVEASHCDCRAPVVEQDDRDKNPQAELAGAESAEVVATNGSASRLLRPVAHSEMRPGSRDPLSRIRTRAPPTSHA
jgi:hypothetical protein